MTIIWYGNHPLNILWKTNRLAILPTSVLSMLILSLSRLPLRPMNEVSSKCNNRFVKITLKSPLCLYGHHHYDCFFFNLTITILQCSSLNIKYYDHQSHITGHNDHYAAGAQSRYQMNILQYALIRNYHKYTHRLNVETVRKMLERQGRSANRDVHDWAVQPREDCVNEASICSYHHWYAEHDGCMQSYCGISAITGTNWRWITGLGSKGCLSTWGSQEHRRILAAKCRKWQRISVAITIQP